jgi:hypothetical protein
MRSAAALHVYRTLRQHKKQAPGGAACLFIASAQSQQVEELSTGSLSAEGALIGSEVAIENPAHAQSQRLNQTIG